MKLKLAISTCPNDTFIFEALINKRVDTQGLSFEVHLADIEELNNLAITGGADVVKLSYAAYPLVSTSYQMLSSGGALGKGVGPLVVSKRKIYPNELQQNVAVAVPGLNTTANLLFSIFFPRATSKSVVHFSQIEEAVASNAFDAGVIIHESRFTYQKKGLQRVADLGQMWEQTYNLLIPLGGIAINRHLPVSVKSAVDGIIQNSLRFASANPGLSAPFVRQYAQELDAQTIHSHIELYVNNYSVNLEDEGRKAATTLWAEAHKKGLVPKVTDPVFIG